MADTTKRTRKGRRKLKRKDNSENTSTPSSDPSGVHSRAKPRQSTFPGIARPAVKTPTGILPALRVALVAIAEEGEVRLLFLNPNEEPPPGVPTAMLVATSPEEAERLHALFETTTAKL
jgi:hypothetical protein